jgi:hypothetical protein
MTHEKILERSHVFKGWDFCLVSPDWCFLCLDCCQWNEILIVLNSGSNLLPTLWKESSRAIVGLWSEGKGAANPGGKNGVKKCTRILDRSTSILQKTNPRYYSPHITNLIPKYLVLNHISTMSSFNLQALRFVITTFLPSRPRQMLSITSSF